MDAMLRLIRMDTTLPGLMSMPIHLGIMFPIITPIEREVRHTTPLAIGVLIHARLRALHRGGV